MPESTFSNSISVDQVAAEDFGKHSRFASLQLTSKDAEQSGHGPGLSLAWNRLGKPITGVDTLLIVCEKLFGDEKTLLADRHRMLKEQRSVLDAVLAQAQAIDKTLSKSDKDKLNAVKEADGSSLLDNVCLSFGSNIRSINYLDNCPTVIAGGGAGLKHGRDIVLEAKQTPLANLWFTLLRGVGSEAPR